MPSISTICALFAVMVVVLPVPAPAKIRRGLGLFEGEELAVFQGGEEGVDKYAPQKTTCETADRTR